MIEVICNIGGGASFFTASITSCAPPTRIDGLLLNCFASREVKRVDIGT